MKNKNFSHRSGYIIIFLILMSMVPLFGFVKNKKTEPANQKTSALSLATEENYYRDIYPDTWVAADALGREMPSYSEVGPVKKDQRRVVGIFYVTWHTQDKIKMEQPYRANVNKILHIDPSAGMDANHKLWYTNSYHWEEPELGYFLSQDEYVIRKDMSMLADAGVDVLVMDVTNAVCYWDEWDVIFTTMQKMKEEGNKIPKFIFWAFNGPVITVVQNLYDRIYKEEKYKDLWFYWDEKPLLLYNATPTFDANREGIQHPNPHYDPKAKTDPSHPHYQDPDYTEEFYKDYTREVKNFFTLRTMWWGYYEWGGKRFVGTEDNWSFGYNLADPRVKAMKPEELLSTHKGKREQAAVTPAQHPMAMAKENMGVGKSWSRQYGEPKLNEYDLPDSAYVPWLKKKVAHPEGYGIYFQERWNEAINANPEFIYINDWNEWTAGKYQPEGGGTIPWLGRNNPFYFVDQYNPEFNRTIQPMHEGYTDNYYMQMVQNIRRYKGVRPIPIQKGYHEIKIDGNFSGWRKITNEFRDTRNDVFHRDALGYSGIHYVNQSGRNDIVTSKVAVDSKNLYFYVETSNKITSHTDNNWMLLFIDVDNDSETGWYGYDFVVNKNVIDNKTTTISKYDSSNPYYHWIGIGTLEYRYVDNELEIAIPRELLKLTDDNFTIDFKWADNPADLKNPISLCINGDTAPNRRFNYRFIWKK